MTRAFNHLLREGFNFAEGDLAILSPYLAEPVNRLRRYTVELGLSAPDIDYFLPIWVTTPSKLFTERCL